MKNKHLYLINIRAESNFRENTSLGATSLDDINTIRNRAKASVLSSISLDDILMERRKELAFEGFLLHDIKRTAGSVGSLPWNSDKLVFPIPLREMQVNSKLVQNPGYN
ncbi:RagB/SusD family nutrient uptake outer membrane protein [Elizabethkingia sp. HX XZB]|uniref:RagB/SusD family nutrient uptake outer membrane protein n=1 Tax=Elizabethkingia sp. HX XZB TaxID=3003193 RepID=UPI002A23D0E1|nr:RagB/SusD family nutrient uptake outer membrane protein [Elizabethkingia sp. HX XZB]MDX8567219.1 RagB/SusD family nutrient uptake outer membrane protein [Elizabethkingia sp. HX XZB]